MGDKNLTVDLIPLIVNHFDVILGMDWLSENHATINCEEKRVIFKSKDQGEFSFQGYRVATLPHQTYENKTSCYGFLCFVIDTKVVEPTIENIPIVQEFTDVFPEELPDVLIEREIEFGIEIMPGSQPVSKAPYRMAPIELKELKNQLQELLNKGFIRPSVSPWGAPVLFVKKKDYTCSLCCRFQCAGVSGSYDPNVCMK